MPSRRDVDRLRAFNNELTARAIADLEKIWGQLDLKRPEFARDILLEVVPEIVDRYGEIGAVAAAEWYEDLRAASGQQGRSPAQIAELVPREAVQSSVRYAAGGLFDQPLNVLGLLKQSMHKHVLQPSRDTVAINAQIGNVRWARVPRGINTCDFCLMLASRGFVYYSEHTASSRADGRKFHGGCHCLPVPDWSTSPVLDGYDPAALKREWQARERGVADRDEPDVSDKARWDAYWARRQAFLGIEAGTDVLYPHEVRFVERFHVAGQSLEWIPRPSHFQPSNDFFWVEQGVEVELKSTKARSLTIDGRITKAVRSARAHGVAKENFMIDLGTEPLTDSLRSELQYFNRRRPHNAISRLWVMSQGRIAEIRLQ